MKQRLPPSPQAQVTKGAFPGQTPTRRVALTTALLGLLLLGEWITGGQTYAQNCTMTVRTTVSGCYQNSGSKATVSVEVSWSNATVSSNPDDASDAIIVSYAGLNRSIDPGAYTSLGGSGIIVSPQVVAFEVDLTTTNSGLTASASSINNGCSGTSAGVSLPAACLPTACGGNNVGGTVFNDYNADGIKDAGETSGVSGVTVKAYDCAGVVVGTTTTDAFGLYSINSLQASSYPVRVEFTNLPTYAGQGTLKGTNGQTTVQFINAPNCSVDLGVLDPTDYCQNNPKIIVPCYLNGDSSDPGSATDAAIVSVNYDLTGGKTPIATIPEVGSTWGIAYNKYDNHLYSAAILRRHTGLASGGLGGIYKTDMATNATSLLVNVATLPGVNIGSIGSNASRGLGAKTAPSTDAEAFAKVGKVGMGDIDISSDGQTLYFVNLFDKKLHRLAVNAPTSAPGVTIPDPGCSNGDSRPWGLKIYKGKAYVGVVCDASASTGSKSDLRAYVYQYDLTTNTFNNTPVFDFPLTYPKGFVVGGSAYDKTGWYPWTDDLSIFTTATVGNGPDPNYGNVIIHPEPILSDIEFDIDGSMVLGFNDRFALQTGNKQYDPTGNGQLYGSLIGGDILRAYSNGVTFVLENNAKAGPNVGYGPDNKQGPGFGEFYNDNFPTNDPNNIGHAENSQGGLAIRPGSGETIYSAMDPENGVIISGGFRMVSNTTGIPRAAYTIVTGQLENGFFSKGVSIGDVELTCGLPTYLEIGNRLWIDADKDGIQDPCELPLANVKVALFSGNTLLAATTSNANGEYYFNTTNAPTLQPSSTYTVRFGTDGASDQFNSNTDVLTVNGERYNATVAFSAAPTASTLNDSNAQKSGSYLSASVTTGAAGSVNHTIDAGFHIACPLVNCFPTLVSRN